MSRPSTTRPASHKFQGLIRNLAHCVKTTGIFGGAVRTSRGAAQSARDNIAYARFGGYGKYPAGTLLGLQRKE
jgi:hypothetical protein